MDLIFKEFISNKDLVSSSVYNAISNWNNSEDKREFKVCEIDPNYCGGMELCEKYGVDPKIGANCLIAEGRRNETRTLVALIVPVGYKYNMSDVVRKHLNARMVSVAPLEEVLEKTNMEYGSITPIGLPSDWRIFIDPLVLQSEHIIIGGGIKKSKLYIPSKLLLSLPNAEILENLAKKVE
jgi:prolyl-tRNA editing enzyme YbaK/EbsC (Cys-tRNA(Pro) deacylase)